MTGPIKHAENANKARRELAYVKEVSSEVINGLIALVNGMYLFGELEKMNFCGRPVADVVADLYAATSAEDMRRALAWPDEAKPVNPTAPQDHQAGGRT